MNTIDALVNDITFVAKHVAQNYNFQYGPTVLPTIATRVVTTLDLEALDHVIGSVLAVAEMTARVGKRDEVEQAAYEAALRLDPAMETIKRRHATILRKLIA